MHSVLTPILARRIHTPHLTPAGSPTQQGFCASHAPLSAD